MYVLDSPHQQNLIFVVIVKYLPPWVPGAGFQATAREWRSTLDKLTEQPYAFVQQQIKNRTFQPSYVSKQLTQAAPDLSPEEETEIKWSAATLYGAGADTVSMPSLNIRKK